MKPALNPEPDHHAVPPHCRNCGAAVSDNFCSHCGQETRLHMPSFMEFAHEFIGHYVALEGKLWGTFSRLMFRPGALTNEYLAGRRRRYVEPLRLYLTLSILFFALIKFSGVQLFTTTNDAGEVVAASSAGGHATPPSDENTVRISGKLSLEVRHVAPAVEHAIERFDAMSNQEKGEALKNGFFRYAPYAMFFLMPVFALYLKGLYLGTGRRYGEHLLFALHTNAFAFVMFTAFAAVPDGFIKFALFCWLLGYLPWAMQRVYRKGVFGTGWRWVVLMALHLVSLAAGILVAIFLGVALAH